jgi:hypothetical protein
VSQVSPPIRILLVCALAFLGAWMLFLRPDGEAATPAAPAPNVQTEAPAVSQPGKIAESAQAAVDATNEKLAAEVGVDGVDPGESAPATTVGRGAKRSSGATPAGDLRGVPGPVARALAARKVLVLLFWDPRSADDRAVRAALRDVDRWDGHVYVHAAPIGAISRYGRIARGSEVEQSPTVVVIDRARRAETAAGYVDAPTIDQMVVDAFRNSA